MMARDENARYEERWERHLRGLGKAVCVINREANPAHAGDVLLYEIRIRLDADQGTSCLLVLKGLRGDESVVGFVGGRDVEQALLSAAQKLTAAVVRWREDRPYAERVGTKRT